VTAAAKARTFDTPFRAISSGKAGYEKPKNAQTANSQNIPARRNSVYLDSCVKGDSVKSKKLEISTTNSGRKKSKWN
jgi:hypothetical protein